jgi:hypothetical protein
LCAEPGPGRQRFSRDRWRTADRQEEVHAGATWPAGGASADPAGGRILLALAAPALPEATAVAVDAGIVPSSPSEAIAAGTPVDAPAGLRLAAQPSDAPAIKDRWHTARLLRGQGKFTATVAECLAIADARDPTWSPIALVEAVRIDLGPLADPERAIVLADRMIREWPGDVLAAEARELRCRAMRQLGRGAECGSVSEP